MVAFVEVELLVGVRLGKLTCSTSVCDSPNRPDFCVDVVSPLSVVPLVRLLVDVLPVDVDPDVEEVPVPVEVLVPVVDEVFVEPLAVLLELEEVLLLDVLELSELSGVLRKTTERRSISMRRKIARANCERSISIWPIVE